MNLLTTVFYDLIVTFIFLGVATAACVYLIEHFERVRLLKDIWTGPKPLIISDVITQLRESTSSKKSSANELFYRQKLADLEYEGKKGSQDYLAVEQMLEVIKETAWGEGPNLRLIRQYFSKKFGYPISLGSVVRSSRWMLKNDLFCLGYNGQDGVNFALFKQLISISMLVDLLVEMGGGKSRGLLNYLSKKYLLDPKDILQASRYLLMSELEQKNAHKILKLAIAGKLTKEMINRPLAGAWSDFKENWIINFNQSNGKTAKMVIDQLVKTVERIAQLKEVKSPSKREGSGLAWAYQTLECKPDMSSIEIKKAYHRLALLKHPDRIDITGLTQAEVTQINNNFTQIRSAYELVQKHRLSA